MVDRTRIDDEINWVQDENNNVLGYKKPGSDTLVPVAGGGTSTIPYSTSIPFTGNAVMTQHTMSDATVFTPLTTGAVNGSAISLLLISDGSNAPSFSGFSEWASSFGYDNSQAGLVNLVQFWYDGLAYRYAMSQPAVNTPVIGDTTAPLISAVSVSNTTPNIVTVVLSEPMNTGVTPAAAAFGVGGHTVSSVAYASATVLNVTVSTPFVFGEAARSFSYTQPGSNPAQDVAGNMLETVSGIAITNNVQAADSTPPVLSSAAVSNGAPTVVVLTFNEAMNTSFTPAASAITVSGHTVSSLAFSDATHLNVTVSSAFVGGEAARTVAYTQPGTNNLRDAAGNLLVNFTGTAITNNVGGASAANFTTVQFLTDEGGETYSATSSGTSATAFGQISQVLNGDGWIEAQVPNATDCSFFLGLDASSAVNTYGTEDFVAQVQTGGAVQRGMNTTGLVSASYTFTGGANQRLRVARVGSTLTLDATTDNGVNWTTLHTYTNTTSAPLYATWYTTYATTARRLYQPRKNGFA